MTTGLPLSSLDGWNLDIFVVVSKTHFQQGLTFSKPLSFLDQFLFSLLEISFVEVHSFLSQFFVNCGHKSFVKELATHGTGIVTSSQKFLLTLHTEIVSTRGSDWFHTKS
jgi:hypothetical protein